MSVAKIPLRSVLHEDFNGNGASSCFGFISKSDFRNTQISFSVVFFIFDLMICTYLWKLNS